MAQGYSAWNQRAGETIAVRLDHYSIPEPNSGCLLWLGAVQPAGYGKLAVDGKWRGAHVARDYGVAQTLISQVKRGVIWRHVT